MQLLRFLMRFYSEHDVMTFGIGRLRKRWIPSEKKSVASEREIRLSTNAMQNSNKFGDYSSSQAVNLLSRNLQVVREKKWLSCSITVRLFVWSVNKMKHNSFQWIGRSVESFSFIQKWYGVFLLRSTSFVLSSRNTKKKKEKKNRCV